MSKRLPIPLAAAALAVGLTFPGPARADTNTPVAGTTGKGIAGGALLGAEAVTLTEAAFDVQPAWAYVVGGVAGGAAGGVGGYFLEQSASPKTTMLMLAGGMLLIIPTTVAILSATAYEPPADYVQDQGPVAEPVAEPPAADLAPTDDSSIAPPPQPEIAPETRAAPRPRGVRRSVAPALYASTPPTLLGLDGGQLSLSLPAIEVREAYTPAELHQFGVEQHAELRVPVFGLVF